MSLSHVIAEDTDTVDVAVRWNPRLIQELKGTRVSVLLVPEESDESEEHVSSSLNSFVSSNAGDSSRKFMEDSVCNSSSSSFDCWLLL